MFLNRCELLLARLADFRPTRLGLPDDGAFNPGGGAPGDKKLKSHLTVAAQAGEQLFAGDHVATVRFADAGFELRQFLGGQANPGLFVAADDDHLRAVDEFRIIEHDLTGDNSSSGYTHDQILHRANTA